MIRPVLALCLVVPLAAADLALRDLVFAIEAEPTELEWTVRRPGLSLSGEDVLASHFATVVGVHRSWSGVGRAWGPVLGAEAAFGQGSFDGGGALTWAESRLLAGLAWTPERRLSLATTIRLLVGLDRLSLADGYAAEGSHVGGIAAFEARWLVNERFSLWGMAGWRATRSPVSGAGLDLELEQSGAVVALGLTWAYSSLPTALE